MSDQELVGSLPTAVQEQCIARVPRRYHPALKGVCKEFNELFSTKRIYEVRSELKVKEDVLLVGLVNDDVPRMELEWFTLETKVHDSEDMCELRPAIPALSENFTFSGYGPTYVSDGSSIYAICGGPKRDDELPTTVYAVDYLESVCKPLQLMVMGAPRPASAVGIIQGKIYVLCVCGGSCVVQEYNIEGSDSDPPRWESFNIAFDEELEDICASFVMLDKIFIKFGWFSCVYDPTDRTLERYDPIDDHWFESSFKPSYCAIGKCLYVQDREVDTIHVFDSISENWSLLKGVAGKIDPCDFLRKKLVALGTRLAIDCSHEVEWEISVSIFDVERIDNECWGHQISRKVVLKPKSFYDIKECLSFSI